MINYVALGITIVIAFIIAYAFCVGALIFLSTNTKFMSWMLKQTLKTTENMMETNEQN